MPGAVTGLGAISVIQRDYIDSIKDNETGNLLDNVYFEGLKDVANSRKHMVTFLSSYENELYIPLFKRLKMLIKAGQYSPILRLE